MTSKDSHQDLAELRPHHHDDDTIDLGELLRGLFGQWPLITAITVLAAVAGVAYALVTPSQYRVETVIPQPSRQDVQPLLAQSIEPATLDGISRSLLVNLRSFSLIEAAYEASGLEDELEQEPETEEERVTAIRRLRDNLRIEPVDLAFLAEEDATTLDNVSLSLLSPNPDTAKRFLDELLAGATERTQNEYKQNIDAARDIRIAQLESRLNTIERAAETELDKRIFELEQALSVAENLDITEPTSWEALVHGADDVQYINLRENADSDLFLQGSRILSAQLAGLQREGASRLFEPDLSSDDGRERETTPTQLRGELSALRDIQVDLDDVRLIGDVEARIPANAEAPNRKLIVVAATVLGGFLGLFAALIRLAMRRDED